MEKVKLAMIGCGTMGQKAHLDQYMTWPDCQIVALAEPRADLAAKAAARYDIAQIFPDHRSLLDSVQADGYICIQPYSHHRTILPDLYRMGKPLLTEKPLAMSVEAGEELAGLAREYKVAHMVAYHKRSDPAMEYVKAKIGEWKASGECGKMTYVRVTMPPGEWIWHGFATVLGSSEPYPALQLERAEDLAEFPGEQAKAYDAFVNYYVHQVNAIRFLLGEDYQVTYADPSGRLLVGQSDSGVPVVLEMALWQNTVDWKEQCLVCFEKATARIDLPAPLASQQAGQVELMLDCGQGQPRIERPMLPHISAMRNQARHFIDLVKGQGQAPCLADEAVKDLRLIRDYIKLFYQNK